ncbi:coiled-coil domain-containing protein 146 [Periophthalmus magnuspinnatus]|uniref:coiled-coil domain-containing protein 146 n=1 Tax=Periophthalmus magnuspinnatus TaxID=409849 RepID=UPI00145A0581|nr:coiled-coil domain-containing protein 146 [Periophthalmus magnuspinnatus]XP_055087949.1 coiled-coil domain-containing protein 146 [Periophthalmus magnuspinnatus]
MNLFEDEQGSRALSVEEDGEEDEEEEEQTEAEQRMEDRPLVAITPDGSPPQEQEQPSTCTDASASPALQYLDELLSSGKINNNEVSKIINTFKRLQEALKSGQEAEVALLGQAKCSHAELERLQVNVERAEEQSTAEDQDSEVIKLRQEILQAYSDVKAAEDRDYRTQCDLQWLLEERRSLQRESQLQPKPAEIEEHTKALQDKTDNLRKELAERQLEIRSLMEDVSNHEMQIVKEQKELEDTKEILELIEAEKAQLINVPDQIFKEMERKHAKKEAALQKMESLNAEISVMGQQLKEVDEHSSSLLTEKKRVMKELELVRAQVEASQSKYRQRLKEQDVLREEQMAITGNRGILEMKLQNIMADRKQLFKHQSAQQREIHRQMQYLKRMEHGLAIATEQLKHTQSIYNELKAQLDAAPKREACIQQRMDLQTEVHALKVSFEKQQLTSAEESHKRQQYVAVEDLLRESNSLREKLHNLRCLTQIKAEERGQKHREMLRAEHMKHNMEQELKEKELIIMDYNKLNTMLQRRISEYRKLCDMIMEERNKYIRLKQTTSQTITELKEQFKVLENETEIQRTIVINKDRLVTKARMKISHSCKVRDKLRNDISKVAWKLQQFKQEFDDNKLELVKLTQSINLQEKALLELRKSHESAIQLRNSLGIELLEHDEVLLGYYEKVNVQEADINKGNMAIETVETERMDLELQIKEEKRLVELRLKEVPLRKQLEEEITMLQIQLSEARDKTLQGLNRTVDYKELKGKDPSTAELVKKIEQLEVRLAERERQFLEKELLVDQVSRLITPLRVRTDNCREDGLTLAKKLNEIRANILNISHKLMATSALLAMRQALVLSLQQEIKDKELQMDRCQRRLEQDLPPCPDIEKEWRRMLRDKKRRQRDREERESKLSQEDEWRELPNGVHTMAPRRPNAYIPQGSDLPVPKPYGAVAPFKPTPSGANMRHIRKPVPKPAEI